MAAGWRSLLQRRVAWASKGSWSPDKALPFLLGLPHRRAALGDMKTGEAEEIGREQRDQAAIGVRMRAQELQKTV